jgi:hypothetical protein
MTSFKTKLKLYNTFPDIRKLFPIKNLIEIFKANLENNIINNKNLLEIALNESSENEKDKEKKYFNINKDFNLNIEELDNIFLPSGTAVNALNFITKSEEEKLRKLKLNENNNYDMIIINIIKIIYILIKEKYNNIVNEYLIENLYKTILPKLKIEKISK